MVTMTLSIFHVNRIALQRSFNEPEQGAGSGAGAKKNRSKFRAVFLEKVQAYFAAAAM